MGKETWREGLVYVLVYKIAQNSLPLYYESPWRGEGKYPSLCIGFSNAYKWKNREEAREVSKLLKEECGLDFNIEEHEYIN